MLKSTARVGLLLIAVLLMSPAKGTKAIGLTFSPGDLFVALETGPVQWRLPNGTLFRVLAGTVPGTGEGMAFDAAGNLYVARWCIDPLCGYTGNTVERFNTLGLSLGSIGSGYDCSPHAIMFDIIGNAYVGQGGCGGALLRFAPGMASPPAVFPVAPEFAGSFWIDVALDRCRVVYTSYGPNVKQYDMCSRTQLPDFNAAPLPGGIAHDLRILPDDGIVVATGQVITRLNAAGALVRTYEVPGEASLWAGLDLVGDGTFWAANYESSNLHRFDLNTGRVVQSFNAQSDTHTVVAVRVKK